jgi:hypothetical protein
VTGEKKPLHPIGAVGLVLFVLGLLAWLWLGEWKWAVTGLVLFFTAAVIGTALDGKAKR